MRIGTAIFVGLRRGLVIAALVLVAWVALSARTVHADSLGVVIAGGSRHFLPGTERDGLNQAQHVIGLQLTAQRWTAEVASYTDSYNCASTLAAALYSYSLVSNPAFGFGVAAGPVVTSKCSSFSGRRRTYFGLLPAAYATIGRRVQLQAALLRSPWSGHWLMYWQVSVSICNF